MINTFKAYLSTELAEAGAETVIYLDRITTITDETVTTSHFATLGRGILSVNPDGDGQTSYPEWISFTAVSGTTLTGATRGLSALSNSVVTANIRFHPVGTPVVISFGVHNVQDLIDYVDDNIATVTVGTGNSVLATAGETIVAGNLVYLKSDGKWWKTDADTLATVDGVQLGIAQGAGATDGAITNGVMLRGLDTNQTGLSAGTTYYASNTAGGISSSAGTNSRVVGIAKSATTLYFNTEYNQLTTIAQKAALAGTAGTPNAANPYATKTTTDLLALITNVQNFETTGANTWTKPTGAKYVKVTLIGGGAAGVTGTNGVGGGGGGGGACVEKTFDASILGSTETVTVGAGGVVNGGNGGDTTFGDWLIAQGGQGGAGGATGGVGGKGMSAGATAPASNSPGNPAVGGGASGGSGRETGDGAGSAGGTGYHFGAGGGGGGSNNASGGINAGGAGGAQTALPTPITGGAGGTGGGVAGSKPSDVTQYFAMCGAGGGGGWGSNDNNSTPATVGGAGGKYGGGGGGGGAGDGGGGAIGGVGAQGFAQVTTYF